jgi:6-pyruvoyltetrahydropterin/6-carboxytetrahydropterin synthase
VPYLKFQLSVLGDVQSQTGYLCNVKLLDDIVRSYVQATIASGDVPETYESLLMRAAEHVRSNLLHGVSFSGMRLIVSPTLHYAIEQERSNMVSLTQQFEFSAAHRLHCEGFSEEKNREVFGKCNNPEGHGHNYVVELTVGQSLSSPEGQVICLADLESTVKRLVIDRLDHKHLNRDVQEFAALNPSVENIAIKIWEWLEPHVNQAKLQRVRVFETPKTWADYSGPSNP